MKDEMNEKIEEKTNEETNEKKKGKKKIILIVVSVIVVLLLAVGGTLYYFNQQKVENKKETNSSTKKDKKEKETTNEVEEEEETKQEETNNQTNSIFAPRCVGTYKDENGYFITLNSDGTLKNNFPEASNDGIFLLKEDLFVLINKSYGPSAGSQYDIYQNVGYTMSKDCNTISYYNYIMNTTTNYVRQEAKNVEKVKMSADFTPKCTGTFKKDNQSIILNSDGTATMTLGQEKNDGMFVIKGNSLVIVNKNLSPRGEGGSDYQTQSYTINNECTNIIYYNSVMNREEIYTK